MGAEQSHTDNAKSLSRTRKHLVSFTINGRMHIVDPERDNIGPEALLVDFIRDHALLKGTKFMCREGGCGVCVVSVKTRNSHTGQQFIRSINSCLMRVLSCDGWEIYTVEHLGTKKSGYHPFQQRMAQFHGTQCGFCSPGWVMQMYSLSQSKSPLTVKDIEDATDANICRCTGYRPILDAMRSMAVDASEELKRKCAHTDQNQKNVCTNNCASAITNNTCCRQIQKVDQNRSRTESDSSTLEDFVICDGDLSPSGPQNPVSIHISLKSGEHWVKAMDMTTLFLAVKEFQDKGLQFRIVGGNTGTGVFKNDGPYQGFVEINSIHALSRVDASGNRLVLGGAVTISSAIEALDKASTTEGYEYCKIISKHWHRVANISVRNAATLAGNLMLKYNHREFPSDIFLCLETIGAMLTIASSASMQSMVTLQEMLQMDMRGKIIYSIHFPKLMGYHLRTFKITRRYQNSHAYVNAGFLMKVASGGILTVMEKPRIVFGGISPKFVHATMTENFLKGKPLNQAALQGAMAMLGREVVPDATMITDGDPVYRKLLTQSLLYKFMLEILSEQVSDVMKSGSTDIQRGPSYGKQSYETDDKSEWPLYKPIQKLEAPFQCSGEAEYINDMAPVSGELHGAFVLTKVGNATLSKVETSEAMNIPGVAAWIDHRNIPGVNNYMAGRAAHKRMAMNDLVFVQDKIHYAGQAVGVILANKRETAIKAAKLVKLFYEGVEKPVLDIVTALEVVNKAGAPNQCSFEPIHSKSNSASAGAGQHSLKGDFCSGHQIHFHMETQICICIPKEDSMDVYAATQFIDQVQMGISSCLAVPANRINVYVKRLGGGFGGKLGRSAHVAAACAIAANAVNRPVRLNMDLETNMSLIGKRPPYCYTYQVDFDDEGKIMKLDVGMICDSGCSSNEPTILQASVAFQNVYQANSWTLTPSVVNTNLAPNTYCRGPGMPQAIAAMEVVLEHIAFTLKKNPMEVRMLNFMNKGDSILIPPGVLETENLIPLLHKEMEASADLKDRERFILKFNQTNRWKKRGLSIMPTRSPTPYWLTGYYVHISIYGDDGSVSVSHSGTEMGQGINTKVAQVIASQLKVPVERVSVKRSESMLGPNATMTGMGVASELVCHSAMKACTILNERMAPIKAKLENPSWERLVVECKMTGCDLSSSYCTSFEDKLKSYDAWGLTACEVEIDCLTGEYKIVRVDLLLDTGMSLSPDIDVGQVEGAFVMAMGMWTTEKVQYDQNTGELLTNRTWNYKPPMAKDIPEDFRVTFMKNMPNPLGVLRTKSTGEAPFNMGFSVFLALRAAITAARMDAGNHEWCPMDAPLTPEDIQRFCLTNVSQFTVCSDINLIQ